MAVQDDPHNAFYRSWVNGRPEVESIPAMSAQQPTAAGFEMRVLVKRKWNPRFTIRHHTKQGITQWWVVDHNGHDASKRFDDRDKATKEYDRLQLRDALDRGFGSDR